jgi:hypothetical protein
MARKRAFWWLADAIRLDAETRSSREIAEILKRRAKPGQKPPSQATVFRKVRDAKGGAPVIAPPPAASPAVPPEPPPPPVPLDESLMGPEEVVGLVTGLLRRQSALAQRLEADGDHQGAQRATRTATTLATQLAKLQTRDDDGEVVRVKAGDVQAAAERALAGLHSLAERVAAEVQAWPTCPHCGAHRGVFAVAEVSPLRRLMERVAMASR